MSDFFDDCPSTLKGCPGCNQSCILAKTILAERAAPWGFQAFNLDINEDGSPASPAQRVFNFGRRWSVMAQNETWTSTDCVTNPSDIQHSFFVFNKFGAPFVGGQPGTIIDNPAGSGCYKGAGVSNIFHIFPSGSIQFGGLEKVTATLTTFTVDETYIDSHHFDAELINEIDFNQFLGPCQDAVNAFDFAMLQYGQQGVIHFNDCGNGPVNKGWEGVDLTGANFTCDGAQQPMVITNASGTASAASYVRMALPSIAAAKSIVLFSGSYVIITWLMLIDGTLARPVCLTEGSATPSNPVVIPLPPYGDFPTDLPVQAVGRINVLYRNCSCAAIAKLFPA